MASPTCTVCYEPTPTPTPITIQTNPICDDCFARGIVPQFHAALKSEINYPVTWGEAQLDINDYTRFFTKHFLCEFAEKKDEYLTPVVDRVYCSNAVCSKYLGVLDRWEPRGCPACGEGTCLLCGGAFVDSYHECKQDEQTEPYEGAQRGKDYQNCPRCGIPQGLYDGCNHVTCRVAAACDCSFCFICGEEALGDSDHWSIGKPCPRTKQPGTAGAQFDRPLTNPFPLNDDLDRLVLRRMQDAMALVANQAPLPPNAHPQDFLRDTDRVIARRISGEAYALMEPVMLNGGPPDLAIMTASLLASALVSSLDVYTLHMDPDEDNRAIELALIETVHPYIQHWAEQTGEAGFARFPQLGPIYNHYLWARDLLINP